MSGAGVTRASCVYIMSNPRTTALHTGTTSDLVSRVTAHKVKAVSGFTSQYEVIKGMDHGKT